MGTVASVSVWSTPPHVTGRSIESGLATAIADLHRADDVFSTWRPGSPLSRFRRGECTLADVPPEVGQVYELCQWARQATAGWFDAWALPGGFDPTGLVKGWAVQRAATRLAASTHPTGVMVNCGGDLTVVGSPQPGSPWQIGIRDPQDSGRVLAVIELAAGTHGVATSGCYERGAHLIDPRTGAPAVPIPSVTVTGPDLAVADACATALAVAGVEGLRWLAALDGYEALLVTEGGQAVATRGVVLRPLDLPPGSAGATAAG